MRRSLRARLGLALLSGFLAAGALTAPAAAAESTAVAGTLTDSSGRPVPYAFVTVENLDGSAQYTYTDDTGAYSADVTPGTYRVSFGWRSLTQWAHRQVSADQAATFPVAEGQTVRVDDQLLATGTLSGHLTGRDGAALYGSEVTLRRGGEPAAYAYTDENGFYTFDGVLPGEYQVAFGWNRAVHLLPGTFTVAADATTTADGTLPPPTALVVKAVDSVTGAPVGDFCVQAWELPDPVCGDAAGVTLGDVPAGPVRFDVEASGSALYLAGRGVTAQAVANQTTTVTVPLVLGGQVAITSVDRLTGATVADACVTLKMIGRPENFSGGCTGHDGTGTLYTPAAPGTYTVFVQAPGTYGHQWLGASGGTGDQRAAARITVKAGATVTAPKVRLDRAGSITGVVTGTSGAPVSGVNVNYQATADFGSGEPGGVRTDASGRYVVGKLGPYAWPLLFSLTDGYPFQWSGNTGNRFQAVRIPVTAGGSSTYDFRLVKGATLRGSVSPGAREVRLLAHNAATGDLVGYFHGYDGGNSVTAYEIPLIGGQQVKLKWDLYSGSETKLWHAGATDISTATKVGIPATGVKTLDLTHP
ncbi:hypothetical protein Aph02nite_88990 [Actinoplanes philippinensis]|uniref:Carboxypeptidase regulatory-like domain-containing protein n=1 Tax=Actinoplanes philippinensis TaxID=35752 RepID=A0A1I2HJ32_9ACTN|nr:carboxypeptidase-like regulatory domain-containing protein [Actinoplanes philippinensis]GIE82949.1 hypothetical protein Aph02nite_88990 [Actinoplanes philippinensis]SFF29423.1 Carboxypeptidase regulatory-like domain-containing protein [Actinoplanes philippinensis]